MPEFTLNRNHRLVSLTGHTIQFVKDEPVFVPQECKAEAIAIGAQIVVCGAELGVGLAHLGQQRLAAQGAQFVDAVVVIDAHPWRAGDCPARPGPAGRPG